MCVCVLCCLCVCVCVDVLSCVVKERSEPAISDYYLPLHSNIRRCVCVWAGLHERGNEREREQDGERERECCVVCVCVVCVCCVVYYSSVLQFSGTKRRHDLFIYPQAGFDLSLSLSGSDCLSCLAHTNIHSLSRCLSLPRCFCASLTSYSVSLLTNTHTHTHTHTHTQLCCTGL